MALAGRSPRRSPARRWLAVGVLITLIVIVVDASLKARSPAPVKLVAGQAWFDHVVPVIDQSTVQGQQVAAIRAYALTMGAGAITKQLDQTAAAAGESYQQVRKLDPPASVDAASALLQTCLLVRAEATAALAKAMTTALTTSSSTVSTTDPTVTAMVTAGQDLEVADRAYQLFEQNLPALGAKPPGSQWVPDATQYDPSSLQVFLQSLRNASNLSPVHQVAVVAVTTDPAAVGVQGTTQVLPPADELSVTIVVADTGNQPEKNLTVTAAITPAAKAPTESVRDFVDLSAGGAQTLELGPLVPPTKVPVTLTVTISPAAGQSEPPPATNSIVFQMP